MAQLMNGARERLVDPAGVVRRGEDVVFRGYVEQYGEAPRCFVHRPERCEEPAVMEVYGLPMCESHGEEAAALALEEMAHDLEQELLRPMNGEVRSVSPHIAAAIARGLEGVWHDHKPADEALLRAWPLLEERVCMGTRHYLERPVDYGRDTPFDTYQEARMLLHRLMRLAFEADADWLVQVLEGEREDAAAQAAYALALDRRRSAAEGGSA